VIDKVWYFACLGVAGSGALRAMRSAVVLSAPLLFFSSCLAECKVQYRILSIRDSSFLSLLHSVFILLLCHIKIHLLFSRLRLDLQSGIFFQVLLQNFVCAVVW